MTEINMHDMLAQMQRLASAAATSRESPSPAASEGFAALLQASVERVSEAQASAEQAAAAFERGDPAASLPEVMIALQKASLSFQAMTEVRNRLVSAYQEVMSMPI